MKQLALFFSVWGMLWLTPYASHAQTAAASKAEARLLIDGADITANKPFFAAIHFNILPAWHIYWQNPGDSGLEVTLDWEQPKHLKAKAIHWPVPHRIDYAGLFNYGYEKDVILLVPLTLKNVAKGEQLSFRVKANWLICKDICIPESATLMADVTVGKANPEAAQQIADSVALLPTPFAGAANYAATAHAISLTLEGKSLPSDVASAWLFPIDDGIITNASDQAWTFASGQWQMSATRGSAALKPRWRGVIAITLKDGSHQAIHTKAAQGGAPVAATTPDTPPTEPMADPSKLTVWGALFAAFLGGLILNIMPCVLPILSLKALGIARKAQQAPAEVARMGIAYTAGILVCFGLIGGLMLALQQAGAAVGWGFQLQSPAFVVVLSYVMFLVGLNLSGIFELPTVFGNAGQHLASSDTARGNFFTGALAALVATPCTAPFMASALGFAFGQPPAIAMSVFLTLGLGLAFPYLLISFIPPLYRLLPKPGAWMEIFKQLLAFPVYATLAWLLWVLVQQSGPMGLAHTLSGLCLLAFAVWLLPLIANRFLKVALVLMLIGFLITTIEKQHLTLGVVPVQESALVQRYSSEKLNALIQAKTPVFVHGTAAWCITCKVNERVALNTDQVQTAFEQKGVVQLVADWTNQDAEISRYLASFGRNGVPIYVYYPVGKKPVVLPQILTPSLILNTIEKAGAGS